MTLALAFPFVETAPPEPPRGLRPIHYLGCKSRLIDAISAAIDDVAPHAETVCDLFAGSGTVALALAPRRTVVAVDIQEYARVLGSALLGSVAASAGDAAVLDAIGRAPHARTLAWALEPLLLLEDRSAAQARAGDPEALCALVEHGSLHAHMRAVSAATNADLLAALARASDRLAAADLATSPASLVSRYFGGIYFSFRQAVRLDAVLDAVHALPAATRDHYLAVALSTASDVVNTVGKQFAQPMQPRDADGQPKQRLVGQMLRDRAMDVDLTFRGWLARYRGVPPPARPHRVLRADFADFLAEHGGGVDVFYADPPYTRDHYSRYYHVLETMCLRDNPEVSVQHVGGRERLSRGIYRMARHQSPFCIKSRAPGAFAQLFAGVRRHGVPLVLSYSPYHGDEGARPRLMTIDAIATLARTQFRSVEVRSAGRHAHNKFNQRDRNVRVFYDSETLIVCRP